MCARSASRARNDTSTRQLSRVHVALCVVVLQSQQPRIACCQHSAASDAALHSAYGSVWTRLVSSLLARFCTGCFLTALTSVGRCVSRYFAS